MEIPFLLLNILGVVVFVAIAILLSKDKKNISWLSVGILLALILGLAAFFVLVPAGQAAVKGCADGFNVLVSSASEGATFAFSTSLYSITGVESDGTIISSASWVMSAILPVIVIVPLFDMLTYFGILPFVIKWVGKGLSFITRCPKFESFFSIEMMFLGNTEALAASRFQVVKLSKERCLTISMMSMSCVTASIIGSYTQMMPGAYVITAIPLNVLTSLLFCQIINPVNVTPEEDEIPKLYEKGQKKDPFFSFLGNSIINTGKLVLIIIANVIAFVGLAAIINTILGLIPTGDALPFSSTGKFSIQWFLQWIMVIPALLMGLPFDQALDLAQNMGMKIVTNEFVVMGTLKDTIYEMSTHYQAVTTVFMTSFCNFSTIGMIVGCMSGMVKKEENDHISKNIAYMLIAGVLVSCMSASCAGLFSW